jgi:CheY-like chemotaxis protein
MPRGGALLIDTHNGRLDASYAAAHTDVTPGDYVVVEISDSGTGMTPEILSRIFEPFFTTKEQGKGTGLGLSMVFGFMKQSGGHITAYSESGKGTTFRLYLPRMSDTITAREERSDQPASLGGSETILVVEDNAGLRRIVVRQLGEAGYRVLEAPDADTTMTIIDSPVPIHLLLTDVVMPGAMDGRDLARVAVARRPALRTLLTSGFPDARWGGVSSRTGPRLLSKPYRKEELRRVVRERAHIIIPNVLEEKQYRYPELARKAGLCSLLSVPLFARDKVLGAINIYTKEERLFTSNADPIYNGYLVIVVDHATAGASEVIAAATMGKPAPALTDRP